MLERLLSRAAKSPENSTQASVTIGISRHVPVNWGDVQAVKAGLAS